jgi:uncharacterized protein (DUF433 family)
MIPQIGRHIEFRQKRGGELRPFVAGTGVEIAQIVKDHEHHGLDAEEVAQGYEGLSIAQVHAALAFYHENRDELRRMIREDEALAARLRGEFERHEQGSPK